MVERSRGRTGSKCCSWRTSHIVFEHQEKPHRDRSKNKTDACNINRKNIFAPRFLSRFPATRCTAGTSQRFRTIVNKTQTTQIWTGRLRARSCQAAFCRALLTARSHARRTAIINGKHGNTIATLLGARLDVTTHSAFSRKANNEIQRYAGMLCSGGASYMPAATLITTATCACCTSPNGIMMKENVKLERQNTKMRFK